MMSPIGCPETVSQIPAAVVAQDVARLGPGFRAPADSGKPLARGAKVCA
jgi:hypothetical protein